MRLVMFFSKANNNGRYKYSIKFMFTEKTLKYFDEKNKARFFHKLADGISSGYFRNVAKEKAPFYLEWKKNVSGEEQKKITKWLFDKKSKNFYLAKKYFLEIFRDVYATEYDGRFGEV